MEKEKNFKCQLCPFNASISRELIKHIKEVHDKQVEEVHDKQVKEVHEKHVKEVHDKHVKKVHGKQRDHICSDLKNEYSKFKCNICGENFSSQDNLTLHEKFVHL